MSNNITLEESWKFWEPIITNADGSLNLEQIKGELYDFYRVMTEVPKVYCHITGNKLSKILYNSETVIAEADAHYEEMFEEGDK